MAQAPVQHWHVARPDRPDLDGKLARRLPQRWHAVLCARHSHRSSLLDQTLGSAEEVHSGVLRIAASPNTLGKLSKEAVVGLLAPRQLNDTASAYRAMFVRGMPELLPRICR